MGRSSAGKNPTIGEVHESNTSLTDWINSGVGAGSIALLSGEFRDGTDCIKITSTGTGDDRGYRKATEDAGAGRTLPLGHEDLGANGYWIMWVRFPDFSLASKIDFFYWRNAYATNGYYDTTETVDAVADEQRIKENTWSPIVIRPDQWIPRTATGTPPAFDSNDTDFGMFTMEMTGKAGQTGGSVDFGPVLKNVTQSRPKLCITFDDSNSTDYTVAFDHLQNVHNGIPATSYVIGDKIDTVNFLTTAQMVEMQAAGWTMGTHGISALTTVGTTAQIAAEVQHNINLIQQAGITSDNTRHYAYVEGKHSPDAKDALELVGCVTGRTIAQKTFPVGFDGQDWLSMSCYATTSWADPTNPTIADAIAQLDEAVELGGTCMWYTHLLNTGGGSGQTDSAKWKAAVDYAVSLQERGLIDIVSVDELYTKTLNGEKREPVDKGGR